VFSPVRKVSYTVDPCRVGHKTNYDRLVIEITTNGTVMPSDALSFAAKILDKQVKLFFDFARKPKGFGAEFGEPGVGAMPGPPDARIEEMDFSVRTYNCLKKANVLTLGELVQLSEADLMNIRNFGRKSLNEIKDKLASLNLALKAAGDRSELKILPPDDLEDGEELEEEDLEEVAETQEAEEEAEAEPEAEEELIAKEEE